MAKKLQHPVPSKLQEKIGDIVVSFSLLEDVMQSLTYSLITEDQKIGRIIVAGRPFRRLRELLIGIYIEKFGKDENFGSLRELLKEAANIEAKRNQIVHSIWAVGDTKDSLRRIKGTIDIASGYRKSFDNLTEKDLIKISDDIKKLAYQIQSFAVELFK